MGTAKTASAWRDYGVAIAVALVVATLIRLFLLEAYRIPSASMEPTLEPGDTIFVSKSAFGLRLPGQDAPFWGGRAPKRGEVVIFSPPGDAQRDYVKRVVGLPGDTVQVRNGQLWLNGKNLTRPGAAGHALCGSEALPGGASYEVCWEPPLMPDLSRVIVPPGQVFMLGDQRTRSDDLTKRAGTGLVPIRAITARALWVWLSIEPRTDHGPSGWFSRIRFERMFKEIR
jgi:signal peptidase I